MPSSNPPDDNSGPRTRARSKGRTTKQQGDRHGGRARADGINRQAPAADQQAHLRRSPRVSVARLSPERYNGLGRGTTPHDRSTTTRASRVASRSVSPAERRSEGREPQQDDGQVAGPSSSKKVKKDNKNLNEPGASTSSQSLQLREATPPTEPEPTRIEGHRITLLTQPPPNTEPVFAEYLVVRGGQSGEREWRVSAEIEDRDMIREFRRLVPTLRLQRNPGEAYNPDFHGHVDALDGGGGARETTTIPTVALVLGFLVCIPIAILFMLWMSGLNPLEGFDGEEFQRRMSPYYDWLFGWIDSTDWNVWRDPFENPHQESGLDF